MSGVVVYGLMAIVVHLWATTRSMSFGEAFVLAVLWPLLLAIAVGTVVMLVAISLSQISLGGGD